MEYDDLCLQVGTDGPDRLQLLASSPRGEARAPFELPPALLAGRQLGTQLFDCLLGPVRSLFDESIAAADQSGRGVRIRLCFDLRDPRLSRASQLPWEQMFRADREKFLALDPRTPIVHHLAVPQPSRPAPLPPPLRILVVGASPIGLPALAIESERGNLEALAKDARNLDPVFLDPPTRDALRMALTRPFAALHFMGHGGFRSESGEGCVVLEKERRQQDPMRGEVLGQLLTGQTCPRLVVLNACETAKGATGEPELPPFGGVAAALVLAGVPAVVAMKLPIADRSALTFSRVLYQQIAAGEPVEAAVTEGRKALYVAKPDSFAWATPVTFLRLADSRPFEQLAREDAPVRERSEQPSIHTSTTLQVDEVDESARLSGIVRIGEAGGLHHEHHEIDAKIGRVGGSLDVAGGRWSGRGERGDER